MTERFDVTRLVAFVASLFSRVGFDGDKAHITAVRLVDADLMGHTTHGLQLCSMYLEDARAGRMTVTGQPTTLSDRPVAVVWDGHRLPGLWLTDSAVGLAIERAKQFGTGTVTVRRSHHIGCLATYLPQATEAGCMVIITSSDPAVATVAPYGGKVPLYTPNPIAIGIPTTNDPILVDISASITTNGMCARMAAAGKRMTGDWLLDADGKASDDPGVATASPPGSILPLGGLDYGHKGFGLALMIEAMTQALSGYGRADQPTQWGASVFVQVLDADAFGGFDDFTRQSDWLVQACRDNPPRPDVERVRLPGEAGMKRKRRALAEGIELHDGIMEKLRRIAVELEVGPPEPLS